MSIRVYEIKDWQYAKIEYVPEYACYFGLFEAKRIDKTHWKQTGESKLISNLNVISKVNFAEQMMRDAKETKLKDIVKITVK